MKKNPGRKVTPVAPHVVGRVTPSERDEIRTLYERRNGLRELVLSLQENELLTNPLFYEKVVADLGKTTTAFTQWWNQKAESYRWESIPDCHWSIDFDTCEVTLGR
jgi:CXXX repeat modification system protein